MGKRSVRPNEWVRIGELFDSALELIFGPHREPVWCERDGCQNQADGSFIEGVFILGTQDELAGAREQGDKGFYCNECAQEMVARADAIFAARMGIKR